MNTITALNEFVEIIDPSRGPEIPGIVAQIREAEVKLDMLYAARRRARSMGFPDCKAAGAQSFVLARYSKNLADFQAEVRELRARFGFPPDITSSVTTNGGDLHATWEFDDVTFHLNYSATKGCKVDPTDLPPVFNYHSSRIHAECKGILEGLEA